MFGQIGTIRFEGLKGFESLSRQRAAAYSEHALIDGKPRLQKTGDELTAIAITIKLHKSFCTPEDEIRALNAYRSSGEIVPFVLGTGEYVGDFVITDMQDDTLDTFADGLIIAASVSLNLKEYYDPDKIESRQRAAVQNAGGILSDNVKPLRLLTPPKPTDVGSIANDVKDAKGSASKINQLLKDVERFPNRAAAYYLRIQQQLDVVQSKASSLTTKLNTFTSLAAKAPNLLSAVGSMGNAAATFQSSFPPTTLNDLKLSNSALQSSVSNVNLQSSRLYGLMATRRNK